MPESFTKLDITNFSFTVAHTHHNAIENLKRKICSKCDQVLRVISYSCLQKFDINIFWLLYKSRAKEVGMQTAIRVKLIFRASLDLQTCQFLEGRYGLYRSKEQFLFSIKKKDSFNHNNKYSYFCSRTEKLRPNCSSYFVYSLYWYKINKISNLDLTPRSMIKVNVMISSNQNEGRRTKQGNQ